MCWDAKIRAFVARRSATMRAKLVLPAYRHGHSARLQYVSRRPGQGPLRPGQRLSRKHSFRLGEWLELGRLSQQAPRTIPGGFYCDAMMRIHECIAQELKQARVDDH